MALYQGPLHSRPGCQQSGVRLIHFFFNNFYISSIFRYRRHIFIIKSFRAPLCSPSSGVQRPWPRPSTALGLGICEWNPVGLYDKTVSWIPNTDEILKLPKKILINRTTLFRHLGLEL